MEQAHRYKGIGRALVEACLTKLGSIDIQKCNIFLYSVCDSIVSQFTAGNQVIDLVDRATAMSAW